MANPIKLENIPTIQSPVINNQVGLDKGKNDKTSDKANITDPVTIRNERTEPLTYTDTATIKGREGAKYELLQKLVVSMLKEQNIATSVKIGEEEVDISKISQKEAVELVSEDGYFGVEQTSERIFQFAVNISGNDPSRIEAIKEGVMRGFNEALDAFGGQLPEISHKTLDAVINKLDNWVSEASA
ncbi:MAG: hypothetical protein OEM02_03385 [Desulfobulbaceae bacterium]|nr:hypothetical protein [Desulfobulbaceae bacterium]